MAGRKSKEERQEERNAPQSPYINARREWNERYGSYISRANNWRIAALGAIAVALVAVFGMFYMSTQQKVVPYAVTTNSRGDITNVQRALLASSPTKLQVAAALRNWVIGVRTVYVDSHAEQRIVNNTYAYTAPASACYRMISDYHRTNNPYERAQNETVDVDVNAVVPISDRSWQIDWTESTRNRNGELESNVQYQGAITTTIAPATTDAQMQVNPLGIFVQECNWTQRH